MTTEVLRNMLYAGSPALTRLSHVVMDEIHYLADPSRGAVWEEIILNLDESVLLVGLSATVSNAEEFGSWLSTVRGDTRVIVTDQRPVPLNQWMQIGRRLHPLFTGNPAAGRSNPQLESAAHRSPKPLGRPQVLEILRDRGMLPAITFIFSRAGCDHALAQCRRSRLTLTLPEEATEIARVIDERTASLSAEERDLLSLREWRATLMRGFAAHHAGMLPLLRHIVEELFARSLLRAVFATETLALGINMPARTVVLEKLVKYNGEAHVDLTPGQYTQLTGRAGRRGIDVEGHAVVQWSPAIEPDAVAHLASLRSYPLRSTFAPTYNMSINLLSTHGHDQAIALIERSFAQFQANGSVVKHRRAADRQRSAVAAERRELVSQLERLSLADDVDGIIEYAQLRKDLSGAEKRARRKVHTQCVKEITHILSRVQLGEVIALPGTKRPILGVVLQPALQPSDPRPLIGLESGWIGRGAVADVAAPPVVVGRLALPRGVQANPKRSHKFLKDAFRRTSFKRPKRLRPPRVRPTPEMTELQAALRAHPVHALAKDAREIAIIKANRLLKAQVKLANLEEKAAARDTLGKQFERILDLLGELGYVERDAEGTLRPSAEGERLANIHAANDLLIAQCLRRGVWDDLDPAELAGVVSMCTFENRRDSSSRSEAASERMADAMNHTHSVWTELAHDEERHRLQQTPRPDPGCALAMSQWTAGAPLAYTLEAASHAGAELTPGDFVRQARQVIDLLRQIAVTGYSESIKTKAREAITAIRRGVVAMGT